MSAALMTWFSVTSTPLSFRAPSVYSVVTLTDCRLSPASTSLKPKSASAKVLTLSSLKVTERLLAVGVSH